jgi:uncharacterized protein YdeI (YjbR/CyaY-like superfamily)
VPDDLEELLLADATAWRAWLVEHQAGSAGVWLVLTRKGGDITALNYAQALDEALCFGWIDGQTARRDEHTSLRRFTPRRTRSAWSKRNVEHVARLTALGRMTPAGMRAVEAAQANGRWAAAYPGQATAEIPDDLAAALAADPNAHRTWDILTSHNRYAIIYRLTQAKRPETRQRRLADLVAMLHRGETIHPQKRTR